MFLCSPIAHRDEFSVSQFSPLKNGSKNDDQLQKEGYRFMFKGPGESNSK